MQISKIKPSNYVYNKKQMIGKGAFGQVFMGYNQKEHFPVAVKVVSFQKIGAKMSRQAIMGKLKQQIVNMQIAKNQNIVQLFDAQSSPKKIYISCQYCNGQSFDIFLKRKGYLTENEALDFFKQILRGFQNLHAKKIVHRDLKPANLLMHNYNIKIADLGFSKAIDQHEQLLQSIVGTPLYMSPQIFSRQKYTQKTDIWSLGVILYEMLYGRIPFKAKNALQLQQKVWNQIIQFPSNHRITQQTKQLIQSMLQRQQSKRVGWQQLFSNYILSNSASKYLLNINKNQMIQQKSQPYEQNFTKLFTYINNSFYLQSQYQLIKLLILFNIRTKQQIQQDTNYTTAQQFFNFKLFIDKQKLQILSYCFGYFSRRNKITYLFKIFQYLYEVIKKIQNNQNQLTSNVIGTLIGAQLLIIKYSIHSIFNMINHQPNTQEQLKINKIIQDGPTKYPQYIQLLLKHDFQSFKQFYQIYKFQYFQKKMKSISYKNLNLFNQLNKELAGLYPNQIGDYKFLQFLLSNYLKSTFNQIKNIQPKTKQCLIVTRMIYQFQRDKQLFQLNDLLQSYNPVNGVIIPILNSHDLHKKIHDWKYDQKWAYKLQQQTVNYKIQTLANYIKQQFKWNPLHLYTTDI